MDDIPDVIIGAEVTTKTETPDGASEGRKFQKRLVQREMPQRTLLTI